MTLIASILMLALTRAEIIERFRAAPVTQCEGLVQVFGDCDPDLRREYQLPVAGFISKICRKLYETDGRRPVRFAEPGIIVRLGDIRTNVSEIVVTTHRRDEAHRFTRIRLPAPGYADLEKLRIEVVRAYYLAVTDEEIDADEARRRMRKADPELRLEDLRLDLDKWRKEGRYTEGKDDEDYLKLLRGVHSPGVASADDVRIFASRLYLYPLYYDTPFCGKYRMCDFSDAIAYAAVDPAVRYAAYIKATEVVVYGGGRGEKMAAAADAYSKFLMELARYKLSKEELEKMLSEADAKLKGVLE